uniref:Isoform 4 of H(+)/Cl(-) exchange transporter 6 n=1 Tax=Homo sapiens TaxID=9606 RepID=P51797-4
MAGCRGSLCCCCRWCCCCGERETRTPEELTILGETQEEEDEILPRKDYESLDYDRCINDPYLEVLETMDNKKGRRYEAVKWMVVFAIGVCTGLVGLFVDFFVRLFTQLKFGVVQTSVEECSQKGCLALSLLELLGFNLTFVFLASLLVLIEPVAAGSGIPEVKCYLNGVKVPGIVRLRTLLCKVLGVLFSVAGGLFVEKEGPMIHSGSVVGAGLPQFQSISLRKIQFNFPYFRSDRSGCWSCCSFRGANRGYLVQSRGGFVLLEPRAHVESALLFHVCHLHPQLLPFWDSVWKLGFLPAPWIAELWRV